MHGHLCVVFVFVSLFTYLLFFSFLSLLFQPLLDALLRCPQEVHVSEPAQLPLGDRGQ